jgi:polygalacturonase
MKRLSIVITTLVALVGLAVPSRATVYLDETNWTSANRTVQNLPGTSAWYSASTGSLTASSGAMRFIGTGTGAAITYFTPTSSSLPAKLNVGDTLTANFLFTFNGITAVGTSSQGFRLGIFNNYDGSNSPPRVSADGSPFSSSGQGSWVDGYALFLKIYGTFADDQPIDIKKRVNITSSSLMGTTGDFTTIGKPRLTNDQFTGFMDLTNYNFQTVIQRTGLGSATVTMTWSNLSNGATLSASGNDNVVTNFSFDTIEFRGSSGGQYPITNIFKQVKVEVTSSPVAASIVAQPEDVDVASGSTATFVCGGNGTLPLSYWWYYGTNADYSLNELKGSGTIDFPTTGHTPTPNPTLTIPNAQTTNVGSYSVILSNAYGSVTSSVAQLFVADVPPGIVTQPQDLTVIPGEFATFSVTATGSFPLSYQWYYNTSTPIADATNSSMTLVDVSTNDAGIYSVIVSNPLDTATSSNAVLTVDTTPSAPVFIIQPVSVTVRMYDSASFTASAVGDQPITYQWYMNDQPVSGATSTLLSFPSVQPTDGGTIALVASNAIGTTSSSNAIMTVISRTPPLPVIPTNQFNVLDYGAYADGISNNAWAFQSAIDAAGAAGGGSVIIPSNGPSSTYMCGPISLSNNINFQVNSGAKIIMLPRFATATVPNWPAPGLPLIDVSGRHDVAITGSGTIDGNAGFGSTNWWQSPTLDESLRPKIINIHNVSSTILIQGITLQNSPVFHILLKGGNVGITLDGVKWNTPGNSPNTDAMDIASTNVLIQNCIINVGDDNVQMGSSDKPAADITISNCTFGTGHGVSIGSPTGAGVHELLVSNCTFNGTDQGIRMKSDITSSGGLAENLKYMDISMTNVRYPIIIYSYYDSVGTPNNITPSSAASTFPPQPVVNATPWWRNITIRNLTATNLTGSNMAGIIWGRQEACVSNVTLQNVSFAAPTKSFNVYNARNVQILDSDLTAPSSTNTLNLYNAEVIVTNSAPNATLFTLGGLVRPGTNNSMSFVNARAAINEAPLLNGGPITLANSTLTLNPASVNSTNNPITITDTSTLGVTSGNNSLFGALSGSGALTLNVPGGALLTLRGDSSSYSGSLVVSNSGTVFVNNTAGSGTGSGAVNVLSTAKLGGNGIIGGPVTVDGTLAPGTSPGTLTINNSLVLHSGAALQYELGTSSDLVAVSGDLTLGGTLNIADSGGFTNNVFTLFTYGGILTDNGVSLGITPNAYFHYRVDVGTPNVVKLNVLDPYADWQTQYFGSTANPAGFGNADPYGKGINNSNQFLLGLVPTNPASVFRITGVAKSGNNVVVTWKTSGGDPSGNFGSGKTDVLEYATGTANGSYSNNFASTGLTNIINTLGDVTANATDVGGATNQPTRFYRIRLVP